MSQYYLIPKKIARAYPALGALAQRLEALIFRGVFWLIGLLSPQQASAAAAALFGLVGRFSYKANKASTNLAIAFPEKSTQWHRHTSRQILRYLGVAAAELIKLEQIWVEREQRLEYNIAPAAQELIDRKAPIVFVTAHIGAWQLTNLLALHSQLAISTVYAAESNAAFAQVMLKLRHAFGVKLIPTTAGIRPLLRELHDGNCIGLAMDTRLDTGSLIPYFGRDALTNTSAARMALRTGATVLPIRAQRLGQGRYRISVYDPVLNAIPSAPLEEQAIAMTATINQHFERWIREQPEQWMCLKRRWPKAHKL